MDKTFCDSLSRAIKYGQAPSGDLNAAIKAANEEGPVSHETLHDAKIQDFLGDHGDAREVIVRKHRERTQQGGVRRQQLIDAIGRPSINQWEFQPEEMDLNSVRTPNGEVNFTAHRNAGTGQGAYLVAWHAHSEPNRRDVDAARHYTAVFSPDEAKALHKRLMEDHPSE